MSVMQPIALTPFDAKSNVNIARNQYDFQSNPWFGKSLNSVDYPNWGHTHQVIQPYLTTDAHNRSDATCCISRAHRLVVHWDFWTMLIDIRNKGGAHQWPPCNVQRLGMFVTALVHSKTCCRQRSACLLNCVESTALPSAINLERLLQTGHAPTHVWLVLLAPWFMKACALLGALSEQVQASSTQPTVPCHHNQ